MVPRELELRLRHCHGDFRRRSLESEPGDRLATEPVRRDLEPCNTFAAPRSGPRSAHAASTSRQRARPQLRPQRTNYGAHIWDGGTLRDTSAMACVAVRGCRFLSHGATRAIVAIHDHLPYSVAEFYPKLGAFNISWHERPQRRIDSYIATEGHVDQTGDGESRRAARRRLRDSARSGGNGPADAVTVPAAEELLDVRSTCACRRRTRWRCRRPKRRR